MQTVHLHRLCFLTLILLTGLLYGCSEAPTAADAPDQEALLASLDLTVEDLAGVNADAILSGLDASAIVEAVRASEDESVASAKKNSFVEPGESIQHAIDAAPDGSSVFIRPGTYVIDTTLTITKSLQLVGLGGPGAVVIEEGPRFEEVKDPNGNPQRNGIAARGVDGVSLINLTVHGFPGNGVFFAATDNFLLFRLITDQARSDSADPYGAYGLFPVRSKNGLIAHCVATRSDDAGIYVGQSENVAVVHNEAYGNVIGLEAENVKQTVWAHNRAYDNAAGMLAILLPPSRYVSVIQAEQLYVTHNRVTDNNGLNFAEEGELASFVPSGTGLLVIGYDDSMIARNRVTGNAFTGIGLGSALTLLQAAGRLPTDPVGLAQLATVFGDPNPDDVQIVDNRVTDNGTAETSPFPLPPVDLLWDKAVIDALTSVPGFPFSGYQPGNCWEDNTYATSEPEVLPTCGASS